MRAAKRNAIVQPAASGMHLMASGTSANPEPLHAHRDGRTRAGLFRGWPLDESGLSGGQCHALEMALEEVAIIVGQQQTCAHHQGAVCIQDPFEGGRQRSAHGASEFEAGEGAGTAVRTERRYHRHRHALHRLAAAHGARLPDRRGAQEARAQAGVGEDGRRARRCRSIKSSRQALQSSSLPNTS